MSDRADITPRAVDRRRFMVGATNAVGAAALAGWLGRPGPAEAAVEASPQLQAEDASEFTVYQDAPTIVSVDGPGDRLGDAFYFHADLRLAPEGDVVGQVFGVKTVVRADPLLEQRITQLFFMS